MCHVNRNNFRRNIWRCEVPEAKLNEILDKALTARVQAMLLRKLGTPSLLIDVLAKDGKVHLGGILSASIADEEIRTLAKTVAGVQKVLTDFETTPSEILRCG
jgi:osmotically-inducible protein OsmY